MNVTINSPLVKTIIDVQCDKCDFTGTVEYEAPRISELTVGGKITFDKALCPSCETGEIFAHGGQYIRDDATGRMNRKGDAHISL
jgi:hypothetical protein